jgi:hypothetical protein
VYQSEFVIVRNNTCHHNALSGEIKGGELNLDDSGSLVAEDNIAVSAGKGAIRPCSVPAVTMSSRPATCGTGGLTLRVRAGMR